jgi:hypothetical protein
VLALRATAANTPRMMVAAAANTAKGVPVTGTLRFVR